MHSSLLIWKVGNRLTGLQGILASAHPFSRMAKEPITPPVPKPAEPGTNPQPDPQPYTDPVKEPPFDPPDERPLRDPIPPNTDQPRM
jgi:hypothetical protein